MWVQTAKQQIEEMANLLYNNQHKIDVTNPFEVAEFLYKANYHRVGEGEVVVIKEDLEDLQASAKAFDKLFVLFRVLIASLGVVRKETAKEILREVGKVCGDYQWFKNLCKQYGVEVEE